MQEAPVAMGTADLVRAAFDDARTQIDPWLHLLFEARAARAPPVLLLQAALMTRPNLVHLAASVVAMRTTRHMVSDAGQTCVLHSESVRQNEQPVAHVFLFASASSAAES